MLRSLALFGVLALLCAAVSGCSYHDYDDGYYGHGRRWHSDYPRYHHGGHYRHHPGHYRHGYHHRHDRDYCD
jgi:hypothetical protein